MAAASQSLEKRFGSLLKAARAKKGWTQQKLAEEAGISTDMIAKLETGKTGARFPFIKKLAAALEVDPSAFFTAGPYEGEEWTDLQNMMSMLALLPPAKRDWLMGVITAALKPQCSGPD